MLVVSIRASETLRDVPVASKELRCNDRSHRELWGVVGISLGIKPGLGALVRVVKNLRVHLTKESHHRGDALSQDALSLGEKTCIMYIVIGVF